MNGIKGFLVKWIVSSIALACTAWLLSGIRIETGITLFLAALVIGLLNAFLRPIVILLTLPLNLLTLGLFTFVINAIMILFASEIVTGFHVDSFWSALLAAIVMSIVSFIITRLIHDDTGAGKNRPGGYDDNIIDVEAKEYKEKDGD
ncbi:MAG: phage holin family protein [Thermodesulfobacteriota bacterium]|nr:phage holin family protein [Thermodesulfobacteriota bacterium]